MIQKNEQDVSALIESLPEDLLDLIQLKRLQYQLISQKN